MAARADRKHPAHILVVDDDRLVLAFLARGLRSAGYYVSEASRGEDALEMAAKAPPDLALLDVRMPGMDGIELAQRLAQFGVPFLYLSAYGQTEVVERAISCGALGYLVKPLDIGQILPSVEAALTRAAELRKLREAGAQLAAALGSDREIGMAIGILMERRGLDRRQAFETLRAAARARQRKLREVAAELVRAIETVNQPSKRHE
jgi:AmiR/NasT family two-component response regulator